MKKLLKLSLLLTCVFSLTVWSCKPTKNVNEGTDDESQEESEEVTDNQTSTVKLGDCIYNKGVEGVATITMFDPSNVNESIITFSFEPNKPYTSSMSSKYKMKQTFNVEGVGQYPPREWAIENNLLQGEQFPCTRYELNANAKQGENCFPVKYDFPQFKDDNWTN